MILPKKLETPENLRLEFPTLLNENSSQMNKDMQPTTEGMYQAADINSINKGLGEPIYDMLERGGKRWRPILGMMFAEALGRKLDNIEENRDIYYACGLTEIVHNASLIIDDIEDGSQMRRGDRCVHLKHGLDVAINAGCY